MSLITCKNLTLSYDGKEVVKDLSFSVDEGDHLCVLGENGSGKSTLIKALLGLKAPSSGSIVYGDGLKKNEIGYLPQRSDIKSDFPASVGEVVLSGCVGRKGSLPFYSKADKEMAEKNMRFLSILDLKNRSFSQLSGGQTQRVLLARALCAADKLIILDEPVSGLDAESTAELYRVIDDLNGRGVSIITVSHDPLYAKEHCNKILELNRSHNTFTTVSEVSENE